MRLTTISDAAAKDASSAASPLELLLGCHARIRHFMQLSLTLANAVDVPLDEISEAAAAIFRYFSLALPLHEADENRSLFPRLQAALPNGGLVHEAAETMVEQHKAINELAAELLSLCTTLDRYPARLPVLAHRLGDVAQALNLIFSAHLLLEESVIFPAFQDLLSPEQITEMSQEMQQRRQPQLSRTIHVVH